MSSQSLTAAAALAVLCSCGGGSIPQDQLAAELTKGVCALYVRCGLAHSQAGCEASAFGGLILNNYDASIAAGKIVYDGASAKACLDSYSKLSCSGFPVASIEACRLVYQGQVKIGSACASSVECTRDAWCDTSGTTNMCMGTCAARVALGGAATNSGACAENLTLINGTCQNPPGLGAPCSQTTFCDLSQDLYCGTGGTCEKARQEGESCDTMHQCSFVFLSCVSGTCQKPHDIAGTCGGSPSTGNCMLDLYCDSTSMTCKEPGGAGAMCTSGSACLRPLVCAGSTTAMTCTQPTAEGGSCATVPCDSQTTYCDSTTKICKKRIAVGQPCMPSELCVQNSYCNAMGKCQSFTNSCP